MWYLFSLLSPSTAHGSRGWGRLEQVQALTPPQRLLCCKWAPHPLTRLCREGTNTECPQTNLQRASFCSGRTMCREFDACFLWQSTPTPSLCAAEAHGAARRVQPHFPSLAQPLGTECFKRVWKLPHGTGTDPRYLKDLNHGWAKLWRGRCARQPHTCRQKGTVAPLVLPLPSCLGLQGMCSWKV